MRFSRLLRLGAGGSHGHGAGASKEFGGACRQQQLSRTDMYKSDIYATIAGFHAPHVDPKYERIATFLGTVMWFWVFYRAKEDGPALIGAY